MSLISRWEIVPLEQISSNQRQLAFGNKAINLAAIHRAGFHVPVTYVMPHECLETLLFDQGKTHEFESLVENEGINRFNKLRKLLCGLQFSPSQERDLEMVLSKINAPLIVRSSSSDEDRLFDSKAGIYSSFSGIMNVEQLKQAIINCYAQAYSIGVFQSSGKFSQKNGIILQEYIFGDTAGIAFSYNPVTGDSNEIVINYAQGQNDELTDGSLSGEEMIVEKCKARSWNLPESFSQLSSEVLELEHLMGHFVDVEWLIQNKQIYIVEKFSSS